MAVLLFQLISATRNAHSSKPSFAGKRRPDHFRTAAASSRDAPKGCPTRRSPSHPATASTRWANGAAALRSRGSRGFPVNAVKAVRARSRTNRWRRSSKGRWKARPGTRRTGRSGRWLRRPGCRTPRSAGSGTRSACSRIAARPSSSPPIRCSSTRSMTSSRSTCRRQPGPSCCALTGNPGSRLWIADSRCCPWRRAWRSGGPMPAPATARPPCSPRWTWPLVP